jgi:hypothetical protein
LRGNIVAAGSGVRRKSGGARLNRELSVEEFALGIEGMESSFSEAGDGEDAEDSETDKKNSLGHFCFKKNERDFRILEKI